MFIPMNSLIPTYNAIYFTFHEIISERCLMMLFSNLEAFKEPKRAMHKYR